MRCWILFVFCLLAGARTVSAAPPFPVTVTDARGAGVTLRARPHRIVSLSPGTTEMLFAIGAGGTVVGDTVYCDYPPAARTKAKVGDVTTDFERVLVLHPDLVVADASANKNALPRLAALHLPVLVVAPTTLTSVEQSLRLLGRATGRISGAAAVVAGMQAKERQASVIVQRDAAHHPKVLIAIGTDPLWVAGPGTFMADLVARAGGVNAAPEVREYAAYSKERLLTHPPDFVMGNPGVQAAFRQDPTLRSLAAVRNSRVFWVTDANLVERPGPRLADGLLQVTRALHPGAR